MIEISHNYIYCLDIKFKGDQMVEESKEVCRFEQAIIDFFINDVIII